MTAGTACCWRTASLACVCRVSAIRCSAAGLLPLFCPLMKHWKPPSYAGETELVGVLPPGGNTAGLRRTHEADKRHQTEAETKGEMSRFRAFQTRINQGFFRGCQRVRDTFYPFPLKTPSKSVTEPIDRHHKEVNPIADLCRRRNRAARLPALPPFPAGNRHIPHRKSAIFAAVEPVPPFHRRTAGRTARDGYTLSTS